MQPNYTKLKTNLRLCIQRLKLLEKKKSENALKARKEIADYIAAGKADRARIRVECIIREDYYVEAMEIVEMFCDLLIARFGLIQQEKTLDEGLAEAISSLIWVAPRLQSDASELKVIADLFGVKYGKQYAMAARDNALGTVSPKLQAKLSVQAPPKLLVENYMIEIAKKFNVPFEPDPEIMKLANEEPCLEGEEVVCSQGVPLIDFGLGSASGGATGGLIPGQPLQVPNQPPIGFNVLHPGFLPPSSPLPPPIPAQPPVTEKFDGNDLAIGYIPDAASPPSASNNSATPSAPSSKGGHSHEYAVNNSFLDSSPPPNYDSIVNTPPNSVNRPTPAPRNVTNRVLDDPSFPELPEVPDDSPEHSNNHGGSGIGTSSSNEKKGKDDDIDFDDLAKRFEALKKRK